MSHYITCMCNQSNETCTCNECLSVISVSSWVSAFFCLFVLCVCASAWEVGGGGGGGGLNVVYDCMNQALN